MRVIATSNCLQWVNANFIHISFKGAALSAMASMFAISLTEMCLI